MNTLYLPENMLDCNKIIVFEKWNYTDDESDEICDLEDSVICMQSDDINRCHFYRGFNKFTIETYNIPSIEDGYKLVVDIIKEDFNDDTKYRDRLLENHYRMIKNNICDTTAKIFDPTIKRQIPDLMGEEYGIPTKHIISHNHSNAFILYIYYKINKILIYGITDEVITSDIDDNDEIIFTKKIKEYDFHHIFMGTSVPNEMTNFSGGFGEKWNGNTILLHIKDNDNKLKYVYIGASINEFTADEPIIEYVSSVGNNCVSYPYAVSTTYGYDMSMGAKTPINQHSNRYIEGHIFEVQECTYMDIDDWIEIEISDARYER